MAARPHSARCRTGLLGFRRVCRNIDIRTVIACILPWGAASYGWIVTFGPDASSLLELCAAYNSFAFDYLLRCSLSQASVPQGTFEQVPCPSASTLTPYRELIRRASLELTYTAWDLEAFARDCGCEGPPFRWDLERRTLLRAELDAAFFHLYGISAGDADYILETFPIVKKNDLKAHGEYRTKRLILERYEAMSAAAASGTPYATVVSPPPADPSLAHPPRRTAS